MEVGGEDVLGTGRLGAKERGVAACLVRRGLDKESKRDIDWALPGLRNIRVPGVLDREIPVPGLALLKVMVGIKSVRRL